MEQLPLWLLRVLGHLRKFYTGTLVAWLIGVAFVDSNNLFVVWKNRQRMKELERDKRYYLEQVRQVRMEQEEVNGSEALLEKWAREKYLMRRPTEDVYVIVDENGKSIEE